MPRSEPRQAADQRLLSVETPEAVSFSYELADVGSRGMALLIDTALLALIVAAEIAVTFGVLWLLARAGVQLLGSLPVWLLAGLIVAAFVTIWGYFVLAEGLRGRTPGKRAMGLRVMRDDGGRATLLDSVVRNVLRLVDMLPGYYGVGIVAVLLSSGHKRVGDMAAGTVVVRDSGELALFHDGTAGSERDALVREFLARRARLSEEGRYQVGVALLAAYGETPGSWDEPTIAGRLADLAGAR